MTAGVRAPPALPDRPRILVISLRRIGDLLLTTPLIRSLRRAWPDATIDVLVFSGTAGILKGNPDVSGVIAVPPRPSLMQTAALVARIFKRYDLAVSTQTGDRPTFFALLAGRSHAGVVTGKSGLGHRFKRVMLHRSVPEDIGIHSVEQMLRLVDLLGIARVPEVVCPAGGAIDPIAPRGRYAVIHAAPLQRYRRWTREGWRGLAAGLAERGLDVIVIGGPAEDERRYLAEIWDGVAPVHCVLWPATVSLLKGASVYIGPNTSVSHLAAASGCPTVALFGPLNPEVWGPWPAGGMTEPWQMRATVQNRGNVWVVQNTLPCTPCMLEGCERHIDSSSVCLEELRVEQVLVAVDQALSKASSGGDAAA